MIFTNSETMIIEYLDIIKSPAILMILVNKDMDGFNMIFDGSIFEDMDYAQIYIWYMNREYKNPLKCIPNKLNLTDVELDELYYSMLRDIDYCSSSPELNGLSIIKKIIDDKLCKKYVIYVPYMIEHIISDIGKIFAGVDYDVVVEDLDLIKEYSTDSTYILSDMGKIDKLYDMGRLSLSAILLPSNYKYNLIENSATDSLGKYSNHDENHTVFKYSFFEVSII